ncbi:MAG: helix-turn-helix domain-containing protein [Beijerinckiaceae bacterium]|nr:helix-turn-helix domain-containing protein [Beijerinckiaceae bacterium]
MEGPGQVRALNRGLDVLEQLGERGPQSLHQLHAGTGLPKSSLRRLLATLVERRFIRVGLSDGMYRSNIATLRGVNEQDNVRIGRLVEIARPHLLELTRDLRWPADLHMHANGRMRILESTHGQSPFSTGAEPHLEVELNMFAAATGLAYLASLSDARALAIMEQCRSDFFWSAERYSVSAEMLVADLNRVRKAGFATRRASQLRQDNRNAIAIVLRERDETAGAIAMPWPRDLMSAEDFAKLHLARLRRAADAISAQLSL